MEIISGNLPELHESCGSPQRSSTSQMSCSRNRAQFRIIIYRWPFHYYRLDSKTSTNYMTPSYLRRKSLLDLIQTFPHHNGVSSDHNHPNFLLLRRASYLGRLIKHYIHKLVITSQSTCHNPTGVQLQLKSLLHELSEIGPGSLLRI